MTPNAGKRARRSAETGELALDVSAPVTPYVGRRAIRSEAAPVPTAAVVPAPAAPLEVESPLARAEAALALAGMPEPRQPVGWELFAAESPEDTGALPYALTEDFTGSLPKITDDMVFGPSGTDLSYDTTTALPIAKAGKRRAGPDAKPSVIKRIPSLPSLVGVAVLAVAGLGAVTSGRTDLVNVSAGPLHQAGALSGTSAVAVVGSAREASLSRSDNRTEDADTTAAAMAKALTKLQAAAQVQSDKRKANQWQLPMAHGVYRLTARFGDSGLWANRHTGLDFAAPVGTPIHAVANGTVSSAQYSGAYGNRTVITLDDGTELWYCHQVRFGVSPGEYVHVGQVIGYVGATGHVTGPHLHLEVRPGGGDPVDPFTALVAQGLQP
ncbi:M23 family metallopeptidase [Nocardioides sp.]|uniref:M23 family metallopeptidase n=1 Tax=Nocardioides sp. TaxID=35761 RepID=UPI00260C2C80|nr:M23 family metallopeptidase [Nocardioides sp.]